ncbi:MAG: hypothetical protein WDN72_00290 [Alphaproteobacteria bacterium]
MCARSKCSRRPGRSLRDWQDAPETPVFPDAEYACFHTELPRAELYERLDARFLAMLEQGALEEVRKRCMRAGFRRRCP